MSWSRPSRPVNIACSLSHSDLLIIKNCTHYRQTVWIANKPCASLTIVWATAVVRHAVLGIATTRVSCKANTCVGARIAMTKVANQMSSHKTLLNTLDKWYLWLCTLWHTNSTHCGSYLFIILFGATWARETLCEQRIEFCEEMSAHKPDMDTNGFTAGKTSSNARWGSGKWNIWRRPL